MRQEESVGRNARCVSIIEKKEEGKKKVRSERKEERSLDARGDRRRLDNRRMPKPRAKVRPTAGAGVRGYIRRVPATHGGINVPPYRYRYNMQMRIRDDRILTQRYVLFWVMEARARKGTIVTRHCDKKIYASSLFCNERAVYISRFSLSLLIT